MRQQLHHLQHDWLVSHLHDCAPASPTAPRTATLPRLKHQLPDLGLTWRVLHEPSVHADKLQGLVRQLPLATAAAAAAAAAAPTTGVALATLTALTPNAVAAAAITPVRSAFAASGASFCCWYGFLPRGELQFQHFRRRCHHRLQVVA